MSLLVAAILVWAFCTAVGVIVGWKAGRRSPANAIVSDVRRLVLGDRDILVIRARTALSDAHRLSMREIVRDALIPNRVMVLDAGLELEVLESRRGCVCPTHCAPPCEQQEGIAE